MFKWTTENRWIFAYELNIFVSLRFVDWKMELYWLGVFFFSFLLLVNNWPKWKSIFIYAELLNHHILHLFNLNDSFYNLLCFISLLFLWIFIAFERIFIFEWPKKSGKWYSLWVVWVLDNTMRSDSLCRILFCWWSTLG